MPTMDFFTAMEISASGLAAERTRMNVAASNLANAQTTQAAGGGPYRRRDVVLSAVDAPGAAGAPFAQAVRAVSVAQIAQDTAPPRLEYDPGHPQADAQGYVAYPNVNPVEEMVNMISASRSYQNNVEVMNTAKTLLLKTLQMGQ